MGQEVALSETLELTCLRIEHEPPVGRIVFSRPEVLNALDWRVYDPGSEFTRCIDALEADPAIKVIVLKGDGRAFSVGGDFAGTHGGKDVEAAEDLLWLDAVIAQSVRLWKSPKPTIAQVHGYCLGAGLMFAMACDLVYVADDARIGQTEARMQGLAPDFTRWPITMGIRRTKEFLFSGDVLTGSEASDFGMVNNALPAEDLEKYVEWMARRIALVDGDLLALYKRAVNHVADAMGLPEMLAIGTAYQALSHTAAVRRKFWKEVKDLGPKEAFSMRDSAFGGAVPRSELWEQAKRNDVE
jgi:enoyl-CoA hydratase